MKKWKGCIHGRSVIGTILAETEAEAQKKVAYQLNKPGRFLILLDWRAAGREVKEVE